MKSSLVATAAILALLATPLSASPNVSTDLADFSYNYVEGGLVVYPSYRFRGGATRQTFVGLRAGGAAEFTDRVFGYGQVRLLTDDVDFTAVSAGAAYRLPVPLPDAMDVYAGGGLEYWNISGDGSADGLGLSVRGGVRYQINRDLQAQGEARVMRIGGDIDRTYTGARAQILFDMAGPMDLLGEVDVERGDVGFLGGIRLNF